MVRNLIDRLKNWVERHDRALSSGALLFGFTVDSLTLNRVDSWADHAVFIAYLICLGTGTILLNLYEYRRKTSKWAPRIKTFVPLAMQVCVGGLFSGFFVFYGKSASWSASWPFLLLLISLLIGNEFLRKRYARLRFQVTIFYTAIFAYLIFLWPVLLSQIGVPIFLLSGITSLLIISIFVKVLWWIIPDESAREHRMLIGLILAVFSIINILYFSKLIPPIPLSLKDVGVYHDVQLQDGRYTGFEEIRPWYDFFESDDVFHVTPGERRGYVISAIFAPNGVKTDIAHRWEKYDRVEGRWKQIAYVDHLIVGGKETGYRMYSYYNALTPGLWRVSIETQRGERFGNVSFRVEEVNKLPKLTPVVLQ